MSLTQLHPEDLFDKESRGTLTADERARLELHVAQCSPCKLERLLRADFEAENEAPISYGDLVAGALGAVGADPADAGATPGPLAEAPAPAPSPAPTPAMGKRRSLTVWRRGALLMAAAFALVCTAAVASPQGRSFVRRAGTLLSSGDGVREREPTTEAPAKLASSAVNPSLPRAATPAVTAPEATQAPQAPEAPAGAALPAASPAPVETPAATSPHAASAPRPAVAPSPVPRAAQVQARPEIAPPPPSEAPLADAATLFALANTRRSSGDLAGSLAAYRELTSRYPTSREAATAHALSGRVLLAGRDASGALAEFDAYLRSGRGELREEALVGRARALGLQNLHDAEANAWRALLAAYPSSASAEHARLRVQGLSGAR